MFDAIQRSNSLLKSIDWIDTLRGTSELCIYTNISSILISCIEQLRHKSWQNIFKSRKMLCAALNAQINKEKKKRRAKKVAHKLSGERMLQTKTDRMCMVHMFMRPNWIDSPRLRSHKTTKAFPLTINNGPQNTKTGQMEEMAKYDDVSH